MERRRRALTRRTPGMGVVIVTPLGGARLVVTVDRRRRATGAWSCPDRDSGLGAADLPRRRATSWAAAGSRLWRHTSGASGWGGRPRRCLWRTWMWASSSGGCIELCFRFPRRSPSATATLAELAGYPRAARAVGNAMAANPIPVVIPCHRVVRVGRESGQLRQRPGLEAAPVGA